MVLYDLTVQDLSGHYQQIKKDTVQIIRLLLVASYLRNAGDHVTHNAENVIFLVKGKRYQLNG